MKLHPLYLSLLIHNKTRKRDLIDNLFKEGLSVSYDRVLQLSAKDANTGIDRYDNEACVCPSTLRDKPFNTGNLDNNRSQSLIYLESIMALQYLSHNMSQMINGVFKVFPVILDDNETTVGRASNVQKGSHNIQRAVGA